MRYRVATPPSSKNDAKRQSSDNLGARDNNAIQLKAGSDSSSQGPVANRTGLPAHLKAGVEALSGYSMDDVSVHYNSSKPADVHARAYAQGTDIHLAPGQERHLPHEAWHVVQQMQGRVSPTMQLSGNVQVNDDAGLEREADMMGGKAIISSGIWHDLGNLEQVNDIEKNGPVAQRLRWNPADSGIGEVTLNDVRGFVMHWVRRNGAGIEEGKVRVVYEKIREDNTFLSDEQVKDRIEREYALIAPMKDASAMFDPSDLFWKDGLEIGSDMHNKALRLLGLQLADKDALKKCIIIWSGL